MRDPVALAYSGRIPEAREAALAQAASDDPYLVDQGLEALAVLGQQHGVQTNERIDALLLGLADELPGSLRKVFEAAMSLGSRALEPLAVRRFRAGEAAWELLRYAGEWPSHELGLALAAGWDALPRRLLDEALLTSCAMPVANPDEARGWGVRTLQATRDTEEEIRIAAFVALRSWRPMEAADTCARALTDESSRVRQLAADLLAELDPKLLIERVEELGDSAPEAQAAVARLPPEPRKKQKCKDR